MTRVFQIGFNKCATSSLHEFFRANGFASLHWEQKLWFGRTRNVCLEGMANIRANRKVFHGMDKYVYYGDLEYVSSEQIDYLYEKFDRIDRDYPGSKFILNTRNVDEWIASRKAHVLLREQVSYLDRSLAFYQCTEDELDARWREHFEQHVRTVRDYFADSPDRLLEFRLGENTGQDVVDFLPELKFKTNQLPWSNATRRAVNA